MKLLESIGRRPSKLEQLFRELLSVPPTSIAAEQALFAAGLFAAKRR